MNRVIFLLTTILIASCQLNTQKGNKMNNIKTEVISKNLVELNADSVWKKLVAFGGTEKFVPEIIEKVIVQGSGIGAIRYIHLKGGGEIVEKLTKLDKEKRHLEFIILSTPMPVTNYTGIYKVVGTSDNECEVTFLSAYTASSENKAEMDLVIKGFQETFLSNLDK